MSCVSKEAAGYYQNGKENYELRMKYELYHNESVFKNDDIEIIRDYIEGIVGKWVLYEIIESKIHEVPFETTPLPRKGPFVSKYPDDVDGRSVRPRKLTRPTLLIPVLTYDQVIKAANWSESRVGKQTIANRLYCSLAQVTRSLAWYDSTNSREDYENYGPHKKNLAESK